MKPIIFKIRAPKPRNPVAPAARNRKAGAMKDRRAPRGGARNKHAEILAET